MKKQTMRSKAKARRKILFLACTFVLTLIFCCLAVGASDVTEVDVDGGALVGEMVEILVSGITAVASGLGAGLSTLVQAVFLSSTGGLSVFGVVTLAFGGISLALGLCYLVVNMCTSLGR